MIPRKSIICLIVIHYLGFMAPLLTLAQTTTLSGIKNQLDYMFSGLDKTKVPTGFLWDTAVNLVETGSYNGSALTDSNYVTLPLLGDMLYSINSASVGADTICVQAALSRIQRLSSSSSVMVGVLFETYNYIVQDALTSNLINYSNGVVSDVYDNGVWQNPYGTDVLFGYAIGNDCTVNESVTYNFANVDSLSTLSFSSIQFDPGDGNGFRTLSSNGTCTLTYQETGYKETRLKMTVGGQVYQGHCLVFVRPPDPYMTSPSSAYVDSLELSATYEGRTYRAKVVYKNTVTFNKRPIIVSEGFDPWRLYSGKTIHSYSGFTDIESILNYKHNTQYAFFSNYDVFYVDWYDCGADIRANAEVLKAVIRWVNSHNQSGEPNIVLGQSMGGLIARYALRDMELHNEAHNTTLFISHDAPHLGANVSPGLLYLYWDLRQVTKYVLPVYDFIVSLFHDSNLSEVNNLGNYQSVKQMLSLYMDSTWNYNSTEYDALMSTLFNRGFPKGDAGSPIENVAIVNGGNFDASNWYVDGNKLFHFQSQFSIATLSLFYHFFRALFNNDISGLIEQAPGISTLDFQWSVYPYLANSSTMYSVSLTLKKRYRWHSPQSFVLWSKVRPLPSSGTALDSVSSSYYFIHGNPMIVDWTLPDYYALRLGWATRIPFIPTASAISMPGDSNYTRDYLVSKPIPRVETPFDSYMLPDTTTAHIDFYGGVSSWLNRVANNYITGPDIAFTGDRYHIAGPDSTSTVTWSTSNASYASIDQYGELTAVNSGLAEVIATIETNNGYITKRKQVLVSMPQMYLTSTKTGNNTYLVESHISNMNVSDYLRAKGLRDSLYFTWSIQIGDNPIQTVTNRDSTCVVALSDSVYNATVFLSITLNGHTSETYSIITSRNDYYIWNIQEIHKTTSGVTFSRYRPIRFPPEQGIPHFMISKNPVVNVGEIPISHIRVCGHNFYGTAGQYTPFFSNEVIDYLSFDIFAEEDVWGMVENMIPEFQQIMLEVDIYDLYGQIYQTISIPIIHDSAMPLPRI